MDVNSSKKTTVKQISDVDKNILTEALKSSKKTRKKVRENIRNKTLPKIPKEIDEFLSSDVA